MDGKYISGTKWSNIIKNEVFQDVVKFISEGNAKPRMASIIVGEREDSRTYVRNKKKACVEVGMECLIYEFPENSLTEDIITTIKMLNINDTIHGILVQLPLPDTIDERLVLESISELKDVDGIAGPTQLGKLAYKGYEPNFIPCTAKACLELLKRENIPICGSNVVVLGRSSIVGIPISLLLIKENATVTVCHSKTKNIHEIIKHADIVIVAIGVLQYVQGEWLKDGAVVIDVGINQIEDNSKKSGSRLVGDVHFESCVKVCSKITPVPGGVGPMTIAMLLQNILIAAKMQKELTI